jgi:hypothetical protein
MGYLVIQDHNIRPIVKPSTRWEDIQVEETSRRL